MKKRIRSAEAQDARAIRDIYAPFVAETATSFEVTVPDVSEMERRISDSRGQYPWLVFEGDAKVLGYAYASSHRQRKAYQWCVDVSVYISDEARNCGAGKALYGALFEMLRRQGYINAYAGITLPNPASVRLHECLGFVLVGTYSRVGFKLGRWHDVGWFHLRLQEALPPVPEPLCSAELFHDESINALLDACAQTVRLE
jgi:L-amino acid N-acyltransferase YncA